MIAEDVLKVILQNVEAVAKAKTIVGDPIELAGNIIVPICKVGVGFGAGGGEDKGDKAASVGGGGGGGFSVEPIAFLVIHGDEVKLLPVKPDKIGNFAKAIPLTVEKIGEMAEKAMCAKQNKEKQEGE
ncbi:MAG TPA: sporulation protein [candidate division Zixibacteria bacterium]|nr:sporulation protein [candidate division Zixibacteria bacterium]